MVIWLPGTWDLVLEMVCLCGKLWNNGLRQSREGLFVWL